MLGKNCLVDSPWS